MGRQLVYAIIRLQALMPMVLVYELLPGLMQREGMIIIAGNKN
jgi:hypothetical protein